MLPELEPYIAKYYDRWLNYSQYICCRFGIRQEAYDIMADVLVEFCLKSDEALSDLLRHEQRGDRKLFYFVRRAILFRTVDFLKGRRYASTDIDAHTFHLAASDDDDLPDLPNEVREAEARFRDDSFITPFTTSEKPVHLPKVGFWGFVEKKASRNQLRVVYRGLIPNRGKKPKVIRGVSRGAVMTAMIQYQMNS